MENNAFGDLVRSYRRQRGWKQEELAKRWGFTREYVSQIERGKRKLEKNDQVRRLADLLGIPQEQLEAIGKSIPVLQKPVEGNDRLLQALLEPAQNMIKMSWLIWQGDGGIIDLEASLYSLINELNQALEKYRGQFLAPALRIQSYAYEMLGKLSIERVQTQKAMGYFQEMYAIAEELNDANLLALALVHQAEMLRRSSRYHASMRRMEAVEKLIQQRGPEIENHVKGIFWKAYAINYFVMNDENNFSWTIDKALEISEDTRPSIASQVDEFDRVEILQTKAHGYTQLWKPQTALEIYKQTDKLRSFRPLRDQSSYHIIKAQAHCYAGDIKTGISHAMKGMEQAESFHSTRYVIRLQQMSDRLQPTLIGKEQAMQNLRREIQATLQRMKYW
ncbi:XRE family transcriptional regulator [Ktedonosporobacter rubrisoli]|uniref:XRE family transcriptional regulator n=1 Tax=Ktedonosporobacter rubrisoli TaxID=2509675 RepID=A0A4P6JWU3_KTERU|nr:helix-turn-helix transcriptional regulator [Ktedonosporobacter rubrisoli]QBD80198.1 XRE family transcriptional regulator [Ktedonosporobacter rubrisoli]